MPNPDPTGLNNSSTVARFIAKQNGNPWAGCETQHGSDIGTFTIDSSNYLIRIMVWKNKISDVGIKLVTSSAASLGEIKIPNTKIRQWEQLTFNFSAHIGGMTYDQLVVFPDFTSRTEDDTVYFDNIWGQAEYLNTEEIAKPEIKIFPNPTNNIVNLISETSIETIEMFDMTGKLIITLQNQKVIDLSNYEKGIYLLKMHVNGMVTTQKIVKH